MRCAILLAVGCAGCGMVEDPAKLKAEAEAARQETAKVRAEAELARLNANAGIRTEKSFLKSPLEGKWVSTVTSTHTFDFFPDGTFQENTRLVTLDGTYTVLDGNRIKTVSKEWLGETVKTVKWAIKGDRLSMEQEGGVMNCTFTRQ